MVLWLQRLDSSKAGGWYSNRLGLGVRSQHFVMLTKLILELNSSLLVLGEERRKVFYQKSAWKRSNARSSAYRSRMRLRREFAQNRESPYWMRRSGNRAEVEERNGKDEKMEGKR